MANVTISIGSGVMDSIYGNSQLPLKKYIEKQVEAFEQESVLRKLFRMETSKHWAERYSGETAMDDFELVGEGGNIPRTGFEEGYKKDIVNQTFKQSFSVTRELVEDAQISTMKQRANKLTSSYYRTREKYGRALYVGGLLGTTVSVNGTNISCAGADGRKLFATNHPCKVKGAAQSNCYADDFDVDILGEIESRMQNTVGDNGELLAIAPDTIWIPNDAALKNAVFAAVGADKDPNTANNGFNYQFGRWNIIVDPYLTLALQKAGVTDKPFFLIDSKFIQENNGPIFQDRVKLDINSNIDPNNHNNVWDGYARFGAGFADWRFIAAGGVTGGTSIVGS